MYLGRWYQMYASVTVQDTMELGGNCVTTDYGPTNQSNIITVRNTVYPLGFKVVVSGFAVAEPDVAGEFDVVLGPPGHPPQEPHVFANSNYVVAELGPVKYSQYQYAIVTDPRQIGLYVLARNASSFDELYKDTVFTNLKTLGFTKFWNRPLKSNQLGCKN